MRRRALLLAALPLPALATQPTLAELLRRGDDDGAVRAMRRALEYRAEYRRWPRLADEVMRSGWGNCTDMAWVLFGAAQTAGVPCRLAHCLVHGADRHMVTLVRRATWMVLDPSQLARALPLAERTDLEVVASTDLDRVWMGGV